MSCQLSLGTGLTAFSFSLFPFLESLPQPRPLDGMRPAQLHGAHAVFILGA